MPKCVICNKSYTSGAKFCPNDGGQIKLDDDILRQSSAQPFTNSEPKIQSINHQLTDS